MIAHPLKSLSNCRSHGAAAVVVPFGCVRMIPDLLTYWERGQRPKSLIAIPIQYLGPCLALCAASPSVLRFRCILLTVWGAFNPHVLELQPTPWAILTAWYLYGGFPPAPVLSHHTSRIALRGPM